MASGFNRLSLLQEAMRTTMVLYEENTATRQERSFALLIRGWLLGLEDGLDGYRVTVDAKFKAEEALEKIADHSLSHDSHNQPGERELCRACIAAAALGRPMDQEEDEDEV